MKANSLEGISKQVLEKVELPTSFENFDAEDYELLEGFMQYVRPAAEAASIIGAAANIMNHAVDIRHLHAAGDKFGVVRSLATIALHAGEIHDSASSLHHGYSDYITKKVAKEAKRNARRAKRAAKADSTASAHAQPIKEMLEVTSRNLLMEDFDVQCLQEEFLLFEGVIKSIGRITGSKVIHNTGDVLDALSAFKNSMEKIDAAITAYKLGKYGVMLVTLASVVHFSSELYQKIKDYIEKEEKLDAARQKANIRRRATAKKRKADAENVKVSATTIPSEVVDAIRREKESRKGPNE